MVMVVEEEVATAAGELLRTQTRKAQNSRRGKSKINDKEKNSCFQRLRNSESILSCALQPFISYQQSFVFD